jgi:hypothetical protein
MKDVEYITAQLSTSAGDEIHHDTKQHKYIINPQLHFWKDAKKEYKEYLDLIVNDEKHSKDWVYPLSIILKLGISLTALFGANYTSKTNEDTPSLLKFVNDILPWKLEKENPALYDDLLELDEAHKNLCKHYDRRKISELENIKIDDLKKYMDTTKEVWKWYMKNNNNGIITPEMVEEFIENFHND